MASIITYQDIFYPLPSSFIMKQSFLSFSSRGEDPGSVPGLDKLDS